MNAIQTLIKHVTFALEHPSNKDSRLVRTLAVSDTLYVPENYRIPTPKELGWITIDLATAREDDALHAFIKQEVIKSKVDGLSPSGVSEVIRTVNESKLTVLNVKADKQRSTWVQRYGIKVTMPGREKEELWYEANALNPLFTYERHEWTGVGDPHFYSSCVWVSDVVAAGKAKEILDRWQAMGFSAKPIATEVREVCYGRQQIQLSTEFQRDALHGSVCAFTPYRSAEMT